MKKIIFILFAFLFSTIINAQAPAFPFPYHVTYTAGSIKPNNQTQSQIDNEVINFYNAWKPVYLKAGCTSGQYYIEYVNGNEICVSEGQGYGMVIVAYMAGYDPNAKTYFDGLYQWYKAHPSTINTTLMNWQQKTGCISDGNDAATDGDLDIAFSLLLADKQWGSGGTINYLQEALNLIAAIKQSEIYSPVHSTNLGDWALTDPTYKDDTRPSDFMYDHFRSFQNATSDNTWNTVLNECYNLVDSIQTNFSATTGLLPDFVEDCDGTPHPAAANFLEGAEDGFYNYNACRTPWHLGVDYLVNGDVRAKNACDKINTWLKGHTSNNTGNIRSGYKLDGSNISGNNYQDLCFMAPFAVGACVNSVNQTWVNDIWTFLIGQNVASFDYYNNTIKLLCMIVMAGDYWMPQNVTTAIDHSSMNKSEVVVYPNPSSGMFNVKLPANESHVQVLNSLGEVIHDLNVKNTKELDFNITVPGMYYLQVNCVSGSTTRKIIISR